MPFIKKEKDSRRSEEDSQADLLKLKKKDLLEIMLRQSEEIDKLRDQVAELEKQLNDYYFDLSKIGSIAEASLVVTGIFEEAEKAAKIYLMNIKNRIK